jgi:hypothetical protein
VKRNRRGSAGDGVARDGPFGRRHILALVIAAFVCGFATFQQCLATIGGICQPNGTPPPVAAGVRTKRTRHARRHR